MPAVDRPRVVVAMSGGVDSSVCAALLAQQGYPVIGIMLRLWSEPGREDANRCCAPDAMTMARRVAARLGIPFYVLDAQEYFYQTVVQDFINGYSAGQTPNPCLVCNRLVRWDFLLQKALNLEASYLATGHYARLLPGEQGDLSLLKAVDGAKDQSYVLHMLTQAQLRQAMFPLGDLTKAQVRQLGREFNLPVAERPDSQDLCFIGDEDYRQFLQRHAPQAVCPGPILSVDQKVIGQHRGLAFYTIGQRKGLGVTSPFPLYVIKKDARQNSLTVGRLEEMGQDALVANNVNWIGGQAPGPSFRAQVKVRYKAVPAWATVTASSKNSPAGPQSARVLFDQPVRDITPGQAAVFYAEETCLGGGKITA